MTLFFVFPAKLLSYLSSRTKEDNSSKEQPKSNQIRKDASNDLVFSKSQKRDHDKTLAQLSAKFI